MIGKYKCSYWSLLSLRLLGYTSRKRFQWFPARILQPVYMPGSKDKEKKLDAVEVTNN